MIKTYQLTNDINLTTPILCDGKPKMISFTGGMKNTGEDIRRGTYTTADEKVQQAIEADSGFGSIFHCVTPVPAKTVVVPDESAGNIQRATGGDSTGNAADGTETDGHFTGLTQVPGITNKQNALEWLEANKGVKMKVTESVETVKAAALGNGVEFTDWK